MKIVAKTEQYDRKNPAKNVAQKLTALIEDGKSVEEAATEVGIDLSRNEKLKGALKELLAETHGIPAHIQREAVRAARLRVLMDALSRMDNDEDAAKLVLQAAKAIGSDPDVGLNVAASPIVPVDLGELRDLFKRLDQPEEADVIDVEVLDGESD
jgi:hypothetical protein